ncbi:hypothetical protein POM88_051016 [Heracleum sosnowskyi]|uniref:Uncharacterized protein n=1 Tax=Heracleum sosnowskyi TaxID=360622 RepID=A0AAD8H190_9APIA|nr:hypothetical protein POM88_051016 [Heracleum sosnowskyi]
MDFKRYSVLPIAVTVGKTCIVLVEEEDFSPIKDHLVKKEAFDQSFLYYNMIDGFRPEEVPYSRGHVISVPYSREEIFYSRGHVISDVDRLLKINPRNIESPDHSVIFNRILGFFLLPAILPAWLFVICSCFDQEDQWHSVRLQERTSALWQHWDGASMFVRSGGKIPMSADFGYYNLAKARVSYSILRCFEAPSTVTPALPPKLASAVPRVSFTPAVSRVSSPSAVLRFPPTTPVPRAPYTPTVEQSPFSTLLGGPSAIDLRGVGSTADLYFPGSQAFLKLGSDSNALLNVGFRSFSSRATVGSESHPSSPDPGGVWVAFED